MAQCNYGYSLKCERRLEAEVRVRERREDAVLLGLKKGPTG